MDAGRVAGGAVRRRILIFVIIIIGSMIASHAIAQTTPATLPQDAADKTSQDILKEIESAPVKNSATLPTTGPAVIAPADDTQSAAPPSLHAWLSLMSLFAPALATAAAVGVTCGIMGVFVLLRREALLALAMPQVVAAGAALGMRLGWPTLPPALLAATIALVYLVASKRSGASGWTLPALYVGGLCLSFLIIANHGQDVADLQNLFTGVDVAVSPVRAMIASPAILMIGLACALLWRRWLLLAQAPAAAELAGVRPAAWDILFLIFLVTVLLLGTDSLGVVMVLAMLFLPAAVVLPWARRIPVTLLAAAAAAVLFLAIGFYFSNKLSWPLSQSVGGVGFVALVISHILASLCRSRA